jgi:choline-glycine betaine transporter
MKIMKSYRQLIPVVGIPLLGISAGILYFSNAAVQFFKIHWLALLVVLVIAVGPWGRQRLAVAEHDTKRYSFWHWLGRILVLQLCLGAVFIGMTAGCALTSTPFTTFVPALFQQTMTQLLVNEGLFPWAFFALIAVGMGYYSYFRREDAYLATIARVLARNPSIAAVINFLGRLATVIAYATAFCLISLLGANVTALSPTITGFSLTPVLLTIILLLINATPRYRRQINKLLGEEIPLIPGLFLWVVFLGVAIWILNGLLAPWTHHPMAPPSLLKHWLDQPWLYLWLIFTNSWWILLAPLMGITLAKISHGYRVRELIGGILGLPLLLSLALGFTRHWHWEIPPVVAIFIAAVGLLGLFVFTLHSKALPSFVLIYLPRENHYKFRSYRRLFLKITQTAIIFLFLYLPGGLTIVHWLAFTLAWPLVIIALVSWIGST